jgi:hypothetical protein
MPEQSPTRFTMVPARRSDEPTARGRARRILGALFLATGLSVAALVVALANGGGHTAASSGEPRGRDLAYTAAVDYLSGVPENVPHADSYDPEQAAQTSGQGTTPLDYRTLSWVGFTPERFGSKDIPYTNFEVHHFLVALNTPGAGRTPRGSTPQATPSAAPSIASTDEGSAQPPSNVIQLDVPILLDAQGPRLAAQPTFSTWKNGVGQVSGRGDYSNYSNLTTEVSASVKNQILLWAKAYASGDSAGLLNVTGDQNESHHYVGLSGFTLPNDPEAVQILSAIKVADGQLVVRARLLLARPVAGATPGARERAARQFTTFADFDLLVGAPNGAQPPVLAWGPAGSAAELKPYENAVGS